MNRILTIAALLFSATSFAQDYRALHEKAIVIDTHNDVLSEVIMQGGSLETIGAKRTHTDLHRLRQGGVDVQVFSIFCDETFTGDSAYRRANAEIDTLYAIAQRNGNRMMIVSAPGELQSAVGSGKLGCMIGVEGGHMINNSLQNLEALYRRGARYLTLTWNNSTPWATSAADETRGGDTMRQKGLTDFGRQVVRKMNELGMIVDVSHVGEQTFWDVIRTSTKPVIASHSCAYALDPVSRNLKDSQIHAVGKNGGVIHLNFYSGFIDSSFNGKVQAFNRRHRAEYDSLRALKWSGDQIGDHFDKAYATEIQALRPSLSQLLDHLDHIVRLIGVDHVGLGSDFDGISSTPLGLDDVSGFPNITKALLEKGYSKKDITKILGGNFIRVFRANAKK